MFRSNLYEALAVGNAPRRCPICQKFFLTTNARRQKYCTGIAPEEYGGLTCSMVAKQMGRAYRELTEDEVFRIMNLKQKAVARRKKKITAATYLYQADCDGEWGEVYIDFANKKAKIIQLADLDLIRSRVYARTAIRFLISTGGRNLPKKRRVIFEPQRPLRRQHNRKLRFPNTDTAGCQKQQEILIVSQ